MQRTMSLMILAGTLASGCIAGLNNPEGWNTVESKHFKLYASDTHLYQQTLVSFEYAYATLSSSFIFQNTDLGKVDILFLQQDDFGQLLGFRRRGLVIPSVPGGGKIGQNGLIVAKADTSGGSGSGGADQNVATPLQSASTQLLAHLFIHKVLPKAPLWFHEGFAAYADGATYKEGGGKRFACFGDPSGSGDPYLPVGELLTASWDDYDQKHKSWYRHTAEMMIDFTIHAENGRFLPVMGPLLDGFAAGKDSTSLVSGAFPGLSIDQLNARVIEHGNEVAHQTGGGKKARGLCPIGFPIPPDKAPDIAEHESTPTPGLDMTPLLEGVKKLPSRDDGFPPWLPPEIIARVK